MIKETKSPVNNDTKRDFDRGYILIMNRGTPGPVHLSKTIEWGKNHHSEFKKNFGKRVGIGVCGEDLPEETNYVELDPILKDSNGIPAPKINYKSAWEIPSDNITFDNNEETIESFGPSNCGSNSTSILNIFS